MYQWLERPRGWCKEVLIIQEYAIWIIWFYGKFKIWPLVNDSQLCYSHIQVLRKSNLNAITIQGIEDTISIHSIFSKHLKNQFDSSRTYYSVNQINTFSDHKYSNNNQTYIFLGILKLLIIEDYYSIIVDVFNLLLT